MRFLLILLSLVLGLGLVTAQRSGEFDVLIKNGTVYDGTGGKPRRADVLNPSENSL